TGATLVFGPPRFDPERVLELIQTEQITDWSPLGSTGPRVLDHPRFDEFDTSSVLALGFGGAPTIFIIGI
ncbi:MAG: long-chain fatty acid--CoA ligase, partial [Moorea sp. SIO2I5]|nr:long-chain fatty acid--CoA ligase [Moorena sp. SIO2I5]